MKVNLSENQYKIYKTYLKENQESDSQKKAIDYVMNNFEFTKEEAEKYIRVTLRDKLRILTNNKKAGKFTLGALRLYIDDCKSEKNVRDLYSLISTLSNDSELYKNYDKNLNNKSLNQLLNEIEIVEYNQENSEKKTKIKSNYKVYKIDNYKEADKFSDYTSWCITKSESTLRSYNDNYLSQFYFVVKDGFEELIKEEHKNENLLGEYGLSMLAICVNPFGGLKSCTCRWNHDKGGNDHILNVGEIEKITGFNFKDTFKPNPQSKELVEKIDKYEKIIYEEPLEKVTEILKKDGFWKYDTVVSNPHHKVLNLFGLFYYVYNDRNLDRPIIKVQNTHSDSDITFLSRSIIYYDYKLNMYVRIDKNNKKTYLRGVRKTHRVFTTDVDSDYIITVSDESTKVYNNKFEEMFDLNDLVNFKEIVMVDNTQDDENNYLGICDIQYHTTDDDLLHYVSIDTRYNNIYNDCFVFDSIFIDLIVLQQTNNRLYKLLICGDVYDDVAHYETYIKDLNNSNALYRYIVIEKGDGSKLLLKDGNEVVNIESFKCVTYNSVNPNLYAWKSNDGYWSLITYQSKMYEEPSQIDYFYECTDIIEIHSVNEYYLGSFESSNGNYFVLRGDGYFIDSDEFIEDFYSEYNDVLNEYNINFMNKKKYSSEYKSLKDFIMDNIKEGYRSLKLIDYIYYEASNNDIFNKYVETLQLEYDIK